MVENDVEKTQFKIRQQYTYYSWLGTVPFIKSTAFNTWVQKIIFSSDFKVYEIVFESLSYSFKLFWKEKNSYGFAVSSNG